MAQWGLDRIPSNQSSNSCPFLCLMPWISLRCICQHVPFILPTRFNQTYSNRLISVPSPPLSKSTL
jgi:hypothetical protein